MVSAYVLILTSRGKAKKAAEKLCKINGVRSAHPVTGSFDIIAQVEASDINTLATLVVGKIQSVDGVERTETAICVQ